MILDAWFELEVIGHEYCQIRNVSIVVCGVLCAESEDAMDEDELMIQWFELVNQKNELVRKESELMYRWVVESGGWESQG